MVGHWHFPGEPSKAAMEALRQDLVFSRRTMRKSPALTAVAITTLAVAIGANTAINSRAPLVAVVNQTLEQAFWPSESALDKTLVINGAEMRVVGVASDVGLVGSTERQQPMVSPSQRGRGRSRSAWHSARVTHRAANGDERSLRDSTATTHTNKAERDEGDEGNPVQSLDS